MDFFTIFNTFFLYKVKVLRNTVIWFAYIGYLKMPADRAPSCHRCWQVDGKMAMGVMC